MMMMTKSGTLMRTIVNGATAVTGTVAVVGETGCTLNGLGMRRMIGAVAQAAQKQGVFAPASADLGEPSQKLSTSGGEQGRLQGRAVVGRFGGVTGTDAWRGTVGTGYRGYADTAASQKEAASVTEEDLERPEAPRTVGSERVHKLVEEITQLTLIETMDLSKLLKEKLGIQDMPMGAMMPMAQAGAVGGAAAGDGAAGGEEKKEEKTTFGVKLESFDAGSKIKVIKEVRAVTSLGLKEAKELVEGAPKVLQEGLSKEDAEALKEKFAAVGGVIVIE